MKFDFKQDKIYRIHKILNLNFKVKFINFKGTESYQDYVANLGVEESNWEKGSIPLDYNSNLGHIC